MRWRITFIAAVLIGGLGLVVASSLLGSGRPASAVVDPLVNMSISATGCDSSNGPTACTADADTTFTVSFNLLQYGHPFYNVYSFRITYSGNVSYNTGSLVQTGAGVWPDCFPPNASGETLNPGVVAASCSVNLNSSTYTGVLAKLDFTCVGGINTITLASAYIQDQVFGIHNEAGPEGLTVDCGPTPTPTVTSTPTVTPTFTPTDTPTPTLTPTVTPTPTPCPDSDGDGLTNCEEATLGTNPNNIDTDSDGLLDGLEVRTYQTDPLAYDSDGDTLADGAEVLFFHTDPLRRDTDGDHCPDGREVGPDERAGGRRDPLNSSDYMNPTHDGQNRIDDILLVVHQFHKDSGNPAYNMDTDRTLVGPNAWNLGPPNGQQRVDDILNMVHQFFHDCA